MDTETSRYTPTERMVAGTLGVFLLFIAVIMADITLNGAISGKKDPDENNEQEGLS